MADEDRLKITLKILGENFNPSVKREDEEVYRKAADEINEVGDVYAKHFNLDVNNNLILKAVTLQFAVHNIKNRNQLSKLVSLINELNLDLEEFLAQE